MIGMGPGDNHRNQQRLSVWMIHSVSAWWGYRICPVKADFLSVGATAGFLDGAINTPAPAISSVLEISEDIDLVFTHIQVL